MLFRTINKLLYYIYYKIQFIFKNIARMNGFNIKDFIDKKKTENIRRLLVIPEGLRSVAISYSHGPT